MDLKFARERCKVIFAFYANNFIFYSVLNTLYQSLIKKFVRVRWEVFAFYAKNFTFYSVLNTLYQSLIENLRVKDACSSLVTRRILLFTAVF